MVTDNLKKTTLFKKNKPFISKHMKKISLLTIQFPEIRLQTRSAHKLRGYFGTLFQEHSTLLHNHFETGELRYRYPLVQYKVLNEIPTLVAIEEGSQLLTSLFLQIKELHIDNIIIPVNSKSMKSEHVDIGFTEELIEYRFETLWMGLNQTNYQKYSVADDAVKQQMLRAVLIGNILSFYKSIDLHLEEHERLHLKIDVIEKTTKFKDRNMLAFDGRFIVNAQLPEHIGLGKAVSRGFGSIKKM